MGLGQLTSPPISAAAFVQWCLGREQNPPQPSGHRNPLAPLASIEVVASPAAIDLPSAPATTVDLADMNGIETCFERWRLRCIANPTNLGVFYFCGHGVMTATNYLLAADFGGANPWRRAFDLDNTVRALERELAGPMYFFIDACRQIPRALALRLGASSPALRTADLSKPVVNASHLVLYAAGEGRKAFALPGQVSRYTAALVQALSGYAGRKRPGVQEWEVTGEDIARSVRVLLEAGHTEGEPDQVVEQDLSAPSVFQVETTPARVKVKLDLKPDEARATHRVFLARSGAAPQEADAMLCPWRTEVPRGFYDIGARPQNSGVPVKVFRDEDLEPPCYGHTIGI